MNSITEDRFDQLSDDLLLHIFNNLQDAKSLVRCLVVSKRFASVVPQTNTIVLPIPKRTHLQTPFGKQNHGSSLDFFETVINKLISKPLKFLQRFVSPKRKFVMDDDEGDISYHTPHEILCRFREIRQLDIEIPCCDAGLDKNVTLLKWVAEFGNELKSCVIIGANRLQKSDDLLLENNDKENARDESSDPNFSDEELKLRVIWIISCLIAASARHYLSKQVVSNHPMLQNVVITDANKQGKLFMGEEQVIELRNSLQSTSEAETEYSSLGRTEVPDLNMKLWHVPMLELPESGYVMKGATLIVIRPATASETNSKYCSDDLLGGEFDASDDKQKTLLKEAVQEMKKTKRTYTMEMNSF